MVHSLGKVTGDERLPLVDHAIALASRWRRGGGAMRRMIFGGVMLFVLTGLTLSTPLAASASSTSTQKHVRTVSCTRTATGHKKVTKTEVTTCTSSSLKVKHLCPKGSSTVFVNIHDRTYVLRVGHSPERLAKQYGMGTITQACGYPKAVPVPAPLTTTPTTAAPAPTPTTTTAPTPPTTVPTAPPTTAEPASCHPLSDGGNCYEPGEYCRDSDHGATGLAGNGETITCEDNDGWRWEPT
jgi:hypothetical protein